MRCSVFLSSTILAAFITKAAAAAALFLSTQAAFQTNDYAKWSALGATYNSVANGVVLKSSERGLKVKASLPDGQFERRDQGNGWNGNFVDGDYLLWTHGNPYPLTIEFSGALFDVGAQIQPNGAGPFTGSVEALNGQGQSIGVFAFSGNSTGAGDNSAPFVGIHSDEGDIRALIFRIDRSFDFAINSVALGGVNGSRNLRFLSDAARQGSATDVPEPGTIGLLGVGALALGLVRRRRA